MLTDHGRDVAERARKACADILRERLLAPLGAERCESLAETMRDLRTANGS